MDQGRIQPAPPSRNPSGRRLLVIDTSYTLEMVQERQLHHSIVCRDLKGFFDHVWTVHPFATMLTSDEWGPRYGKPMTRKVSARHTVIEGRVGRFAWLRRLFLPNFLISQIDLILRLLGLIRREKINVVRVGSPLYLGLFGLLLARLSGIPLVIRVGANNDETFKTTGKPMEPRLTRSRKIEKMIERFVFPRADLVAGANQDNLNFALANGARREHSTLFRYGNLIDDRHFVSREHRRFDVSVLDRFGVRADDFLLFVGRLESVKHPDHVVEVLAAVRSRGLDVKAILAGDGRMRVYLENRAAELGLSDQLILPGNVGQADLSQLLPFAAAVISPHTGRALVEAALAGASVVAYDVDWQGELIEDRVTGRLVPHGDVAALASATIELLVDKPAARRFGTALHARGLQMFDSEALDAHERQEYLKLFERFANERKYQCF